MDGTTINLPEPVQKVIDMFNTEVSASGFFVALTFILVLFLGRLILLPATACKHRLLT